MINVEKLRAKWRTIDEDTKRAMRTGEEFYRWTVTPDMPNDVYALIAEIEYMNGVVGALKSSLELIYDRVEGQAAELAREAIEYAEESRS
ncbi:hypothetical protein [Cytobacillus solani]|uniref:Uncharacterized protein n=1 Tax=Cytobacillus solani TaxID=1637975 RepID=A0A0Q3QMD9_9BACI|nr:hypothetical protein [Cytobacillus solani]KQL18808.1 hypothetical protein AN957_09640 [Cytobacillus solani]